MNRIKKRNVVSPTDSHYYELALAAEGAEFIGIQLGGSRESLILFADPKIGSTLALSESDFSREAVADRLEDSRYAFEHPVAKCGSRGQLAESPFFES